MSELEKAIAAIHRGLGIPDDYQQKYALTPQHEEPDLIEIGNDIYDRPQKAARSILTPWNRMQAHAKNEGIILRIVSAFRSIEDQKTIIQRKIEQGGRIEDILTLCAAPGYSEHHSGRALDLTTDENKPLTEGFDKTEAFQWLQAHAHSFSFSLSYPRDNKYGITYEPWHWAFKEMHA